MCITGCDADDASKVGEEMGTRGNDPIHPLGDK